ncbi:hypothetical protein N0V84_004676 [Fusarium piperis]|uniref:Uncharacterized protein n=1 Tax=Fusarium piperis TaxID=1435070 RepID=A0A9W8WFE6_9HYPO|nr:hypothetical protein N0V84_004676 [Fusarium piperis]
MSGPDMELDCAQNIALLFYLGRIASNPHKNRVRRQESDAGWTLSLDDERHLTSMLGLLSCIRDDINNITAVCVQETRPGMAIMVAANAKEADVSSPYLPSVKLGLENVFSRLKDAQCSSREKLESSVFEAIVSMCRWRILSRIRMIKRAGKPSMEKLLQEVNVAMYQLPGGIGQTRFLDLSERLVSKLAKYRDTFIPLSSDDWALTPDNDLESIVETCHWVSEIPDIEGILLNDVGHVKPRVDPSKCEAVLNTIRKVASYQEAAHTLVKLARQYEFICQTTTTIATLEPSAFIHDDSAERPSLRAMLHKLKAHHGTGWHTDQVARRLSNYLGSEYDHHEGHIDQLMDDPKVHAELQLIWYLDQHQDSTPPPRVIASSKDACYLCNAFITFHGKYTIPKTHGRIYPGWRMPSSGLQDVKKGFLLELECLAVERINSILEEGVKRVDYPFESSVPSAAASGVSIPTQRVETGAAGRRNYDLVLRGKSTAVPGDRAILPP